MYFFRRLVMRRTFLVICNSLEPCCIFWTLSYRHFKVLCNAKSCLWKSGNQANWKLATSKGIFGLFSNIKWTSFEPWVFKSIFKQNAACWDRIEKYYGKGVKIYYKIIYILITLLEKQNANGFIDVSIVFCLSLK